MLKKASDKREFNLAMFDHVFGHFIRGLELLDDLTEEEKKQIEALRKRMAEQKGRHQGGSKWIGTAGTPFGAYGYNPEGVRIGSADVPASQPDIHADRTIGGFCRRKNISKATYHKWRRLGLGPRELRADAIVRITPTAEADWDFARENPEGAEAEAVKLAADKRQERARHAAAKSIESPKHVSRQAAKIA